MDEAIRRGRKVSLLFVDLEAQYRLTIEHVSECFALYADCIDPYWLALPIALRNAVSQYEPQWQCWEPGREWVRQPPDIAIADHEHFSFFRRGMEFEELVPEFANWLADGEWTACFVGIRSDESLNRWRTVTGSSANFEGRKWTTYKGRTVYNVYPIYDWKTEDLWTYFGRSGKPYNRLYDRMYQAGLTLHQMRICQPYGDDQRKGLWLFHLIEPETWSKIVSRVAGANSGALLAQETGNATGVARVTRPAGHTWRSFAGLLLDSMPPRTSEHFRAKIQVFLDWYASRGYVNGQIPDDGPLTDRNAPSWARICKTLLRNDYWCKGLSFSQQKSHAYERYMSKRRVMEAR